MARLCRVGEGCPGPRSNLRQIAPGREVGEAGAGSGQHAQVGVAGAGGERRDELSEDYFLTDDVIINPGDKIVPFTAYSGAIEALVVSSGQLAHLRRDPTGISGWSYSIIDTPFEVTDAAVSSQENDYCLAMITGPTATDQRPLNLLELTGETWLSRWSTVVTGLMLNQLRSGQTPKGQPYWYTVTSGTASGHMQFYDWQVYYLPGKFPVQSVGPLSLQFPLSAGTTVEDSTLLFDPDQVTGGTPTGFALVQTYTPGDPSAQVLLYSQATSTRYSTTEHALGGGSLLWAHATSGSTSGHPAVVWQTPSGTINFQDETGQQTAVYAGGSTGVGQIAAWLLDGLYTFSVVDNATVNVVSQIAPNPDPAYTATIPVAAGIESIYSLPTDPTQATLFAVNSDSTLSVLTKDPTLGWTQTQVHQDSAELQEVESWRVQLTVLALSETDHSQASVHPRGG